jgi:predicted SAM-dependent methyltransferase
MGVSLNKPLKLELGVGERPTEGYLHQDISSASGVRLDFTCPPWEISIADSTLTEVLALGVVEHLRFDEVGKTAANAHRMLAPGGCFIFDVPDMKIWSEYLYNVTHGMEEKNPCTAEHVWRTIYGWQRWVGDEHKSGWTREEIVGVLRSAGFERIEEGVNLLLAKGIERRRFTRNWDAHIYLCAIK